MTLDAFAEADHAVDAGHVQVDANGKGASLVDAILAARGLRRRIAVVLPSSAGLPFVVANTDLIATLPSRIFKDLGIRARPQGRSGAVAVGRSQPPHPLASAHAGHSAARLGSGDDQGNRSEALIATARHARMSGLSIRRAQ